MVDSIQKYNPCHLTVPIGKNNIFTLRTNVGYKHFMSRASKYFDDFKNFAGAAHIISNDNSSVPPYIGIGQEKTRESPDKKRELPDHEGPTQYCPPCNIPLEDTDLNPSNQYRYPKTSLQAHFLMPQLKTMLWIKCARNNSAF